MSNGKQVQERFGDDVKPACDSDTRNEATLWNADPANTYPPGHAPLCKKCFPEADQDESGYDPDFDQSEAVDVVVPWPASHCWAAATSKKA